jgi:hypothetical protein
MNVHHWERKWWGTEREEKQNCTGRLDFMAAMFFQSP